MQNAAVEFQVSVRQLGTKNAMTRCRCILIIIFFLAFPVEPTRCSAAHSKYCKKRERQCGEDVVYLKTETKPFRLTEHIFIEFSRGTSIIVALASHTREPEAM